ncbi:MAG: rod shape-determining protein MreC [Mycobacterium sp.]|nr:rod shape-determining protein MreC [Mycobacterium sp.]
MSRDPRFHRRVLLVLLLAAFALVSIDYRTHRGAFSGLSSAVASVVDPVTSTVGKVVDPVGSRLSDLVHGSRDRAAAQQLRTQNDELRAQLRSLQQAQADKAQVDKLFGLAGRGGYTIVPAHVVAVGGSLGFTWTALLDAGTRDGITVDQTVLNGDGLVGRVKQVTARTATVLLLVDPTSTVGARLAGTGQEGSVTGRGADPLQLMLLEGQQALAPGDRLTTFGSLDQRPYVPGVPVGTVKSVGRSADGLTKTAEVVPFVNVGSLDVVGVVVAPPRTDPRDAVLPPPPTATPAA